MKPRDSLPPIWGGALLLALFVVYHGPSTSVSPNDGSHFALTNALVKDHSFRIDNYIAYTAWVDYSVHDGHYYSDRAPGTAFMAALFTWLGLGVGACPAAAGVLAALLSYLIVRRWAGVWGALMAAVTVALGTTVWRYSHVLFSHAPAAMLVLAAVYLALRLGDEERPPGWVAPLAGWVTGFAMVTEYQLLALTPLVAAYVLAARWRLERWAGWRRLWPAAVSWALAVGLLAFYQWRCFGSPWHTSYAYRPGWQESYAWSGSLPRALRGLLIGEEAVRGVFTLSPVVWFALWGYGLLFRRQRAEAALCLGTFVALLTVTAGHVSWNGATTGDTRYLTAIVPLLFLPLGVWVDRYLTVPRPPAARFCHEGLFYFLLCFTIGMNGHQVFWRYRMASGVASLAYPLQVTFDPIEMYFGLLAGVHFETVFWAFLGFGAATTAVTWLLRRLLGRGTSEGDDRS